MAANRRRATSWSFAAAFLFAVALVLFASSLVPAASGTLRVVAAGFAALAVLVFLGGRLASPRALLPPPSEEQGATSAGADLETLRRRLAETETHPLRRIPVTDLDAPAKELAERLNARLDALSDAEKEQQQFIADVSH
ncbi:MAG: hypothetical protein ABI610_03865, partial [Acidobacteriota bacterium]